MKKSYLYGVAAIGLLFTGCQSNDLPNGPDDKTSETDRTLYVNMNIRGDILSGTRADSDPTFDAGKNESNVKDAYFVFYDKDDALVGEIVKVQLPDPKTDVDETGSVEKYYQSVVPISVYKGEKNPAKVVCYINPISPASLQNPLGMIQTNLREILYTGEGENKLFAMSNSVYYPNGEETPQIAVPVTAEQLFDTEAEAKAALTNADAIVDIYVERYAAKLQFSGVKADDYVTATSLINDPSEKEVTLSFEAKRWILNASCQETYIVKSFRKEANDNKPLSENYEYEELNKCINAQSISYNDKGEFVYNGELSVGNAWTWNSPAYHRSYWGMSPAYFTKEYPEVSSDVKIPQNTNELNQYYYSYNELTRENEPLGYAPDDKDPHYFHETTVGGRGLNSKNPAAAVASVILVGDYKVKVGSTDLSVGTTFYTYLTGSAGKPLVYFEADKNSNLGISEVSGAESMLRRFIEQTSILFKQIGESYLPYDIADEEDMKTLVEVLEVAVPSDAVKGELKLAERYRTLQFKNNASTTGIFVATPDGYKAIGDEINEISLNEANHALMQQVGFCSMYNLGSGYFNIPVKHLGWYRAGNTQKDSETINWNDVRIGDFGIVRNHSYDIKVNKIVGIGIGIGGHYNPIVPPSDTDDYFIAYRVNILKWAVVPQQNVIL